MIAQLSANYIKARPWKVYSRMLSYLLFEGRPVTTSGRWINPLVKGWFNVLDKLPTKQRVTNPVFIIGTGRSGTTVLGIVLSIHKDVAFLNEPKALWHHLYPDDDVIGSYSKGHARFLLQEDDAGPELISRAQKIYSQYLYCVGGKTVLDKYPEMVFRIPFLLKIFPDSKFIFLVRNGWDACRSIERWSTLKGRQIGEKTEDWWGVNDRKWKLIIDELVPHYSDLSDIVHELCGPKDHMQRAVVEWILAMRSGLSLMAKYPKAIVKVRYEDLTSNPGSELEKILKFCGLDNDEVLHSYALSTLKATERRKPFSIAESLYPLFSETMSELGYQDLCNTKQM